MTIPPYLKKGDTIAITCPAGYMAKEKAQICIQTLQQKGYNVICGETLGSNSQNYFSGTDDERLNELQHFLDDKKVDAILFGRGGYGTGRIIDKINFKKFYKKPKWLIGFSDITILHSHLFSNYNIASMHAPMAAAFNDDGYKNEYIGSLLDAIKGEKNTYRSITNSFNKKGIGKGRLVGGNLSLIVNAIGTASDINTKNCILFLEDIGEQLYVVDRMLYQLKRSGKLKNLAALIIGGFTDMKDSDKPFGKNIYEIISELVAEYNYPVCFDFPVSHNKENVALKIGVKYKLSINEEGSILKES
jgi:muramoyltetrapeptide carboxypeptidase